jgi:cell division protein FtsI/penicillin-binding protein 2
VRAGGGQILAVARHTEHGMPVVSPLDGRYQPGLSFTIVSAAALLGARSVTAKSPVTCYQRWKVGAQLFANIPAEPNLGTEPTFGDVFAHACSTAFAVLSLDLTARELIKVAQKFGIGGSAWKLPLPAFDGKMSSPGSDVGQLASDTVGAGSVQVSPLTMALAAGAVDSGSWRAPLLVTTPTQRPTRPPISGSVARQLRHLMRATVTSGAARAASLVTASLSGQVGTARLAGHRSLHAIWFVGFRGSVAFAVLVFARNTSFAPAVRIAGQFAAGLP